MAKTNKEIEREMLTSILSKLNETEQQFVKKMKRIADSKLLSRKEAVEYRWLIHHCEHIIDGISTDTDYTDSDASETTKQRRQKRRQQNESEVESECD